MAGVIFSGGAAFVVGFIAALAAVITAMTSDTATIESAAKRKAIFKETCPELISLHTMEGELETMRQNIFETPDCVNSLTKSSEFPAIYEAARPDEKKILSFAFRAAAENKDTAPAAVSPPDRKPSIHL